MTVGYPNFELKTSSLYEGGCFMVAFLHIYTHTHTHTHTLIYKMRHELTYNSYLQANYDFAV